MSYLLVIVSRRWNKLMDALSDESLTKSTTLELIRILYSFFVGLTDIFKVYCLVFGLTIAAVGTILMFMETGDFLYQVKSNFMFLMEIAEAAGLSFDAPRTWTIDQRITLYGKNISLLFIATYFLPRILSALFLIILRIPLEISSSFVRRI